MKPTPAMSENQAPRKRNDFPGTETRVLDASSRHDRSNDAKQRQTLVIYFKYHGPDTRKSMTWTDPLVAKTLRS